MFKASEEHFLQFTNAQYRSILKSQLPSLLNHFFMYISPRDV